jgi:membrane carboxypeptidase/penicillin-binding protein PbpC
LTRVGDPLPQRLIRFAPTGEFGADQPVVIHFPRNGSMVRSSEAEEEAVLRLEVMGGVAPYVWTVNGRAMAPSVAPHQTARVKERGQMIVEVIDGAGRRATSSFWLEP